MSTTKVPADWKRCATCSHWCGRKEPDVLCKWVEYDPDERARCAGGGFREAKMAGQQSCSQWTPQYPQK